MSSTKKSKHSLELRNELCFFFGFPSNERIELREYSEPKKSGLDKELKKSTDLLIHADEQKDSSQESNSSQSSNQSTSRDNSCTICEENKAQSKREFCRLEIFLKSNDSTNNSKRAMATIKQEVIEQDETIEVHIKKEVVEEFANDQTRTISKQSNKRKKCVECKKFKVLLAKNMCGYCYAHKRKQKLPELECKQCGQIKQHEVKGICRACYLRNRSKTHKGRCVKCKKMGSILAKKICALCYASKWKQLNDRDASKHKECRVCETITCCPSRGVFGACYRKIFNKKKQTKLTQIKIEKEVKIE
ncbi:hypothetical protein M3Y97_01093800 [Aphelenchoides bicaudatus]|nr:hypothetical protein M3Y97_01093800 [Aphelenchoides bicaudatus]